MINNDIGVDITINDMEGSRSSGAKNTNRILRSTQKRPLFPKRDEVIRNKNNLKGKTSALSENVTKERYTLYHRCGGGPYCSQMEGRITVIPVYSGHAIAAGTWL